MKTRPKDIGTKEETWNVEFYDLSDQMTKVRRLAEGGRYDPGDVEITTDAGVIFLESKARANCPLHKTLAKAIGKANTHTGESNPRGYNVAVSHKKLVDKGGKRRVPDGVPRVVGITPEYFRYLLECEAELLGDGR